MLYKMEAIAKTRRIGGSLVVTIPRIVAEHEGLLENQPVSIIVTRVKKSGFGMFKDIKPFAKEDKFLGQLEKK